MISRRHVLAGVSALSTLWSAEARAVVNCSVFGRDGIQLCSAGRIVLDVETARQRCENWCWAACIQTIFAANGFQLEQEAIVRRLYGGEACLPATGSQIVRTIGQTWTDRRGTTFRASAQSLPDATIGIRRSGGGRVAPNLADDITIGLFANQGSQTLVRELENDNPLIIGALGHATVVVAASYERSRDGFVRLIDLGIRDPWPGNPNRRTLTAQEARASFFVAKVSVAR
jgi:hypothetical protein